MVIWQRAKRRVRSGIEDLLGLGIHCIDFYFWFLCWFWCYESFLFAKERRRNGELEIMLYDVGGALTPDVTLSCPAWSASGL